MLAKEYSEFDQRRKRFEAEEADHLDWEALEALEEKMKRGAEA